MAHIVVIVSIVYRILLLFVKQQQTRNVTTTRQRREQQLYRRKRPVGYHAIYSGRKKKLLNDQGDLHHQPKWIDFRNTIQKSCMAEVDGLGVLFWTFFLNKKHKNMVIEGERR